MQASWVTGLLRASDCPVWSSAWAPATFTASWSCKFCLLDGLHLRYLLLCLHAPYVDTSLEFLPKAA